MRRQDVDVKLVELYAGVFVFRPRRSSQYGMEVEIPLDLVALVRCFFRS
jgi:hypothetical protein